MTITFEKTIDFFLQIMYNVYSLLFGVDFTYGTHKTGGKNL